jgi:hypothetical protein
MQKVTLYFRPTAGNRTPRRVKDKDNLPMGTVYVLRYAGCWETIDCDKTSEARAAALRKQIELHTGKAELQQPKPGKPADERGLDVAVDRYIENRGQQRNWRKRTYRAYEQTLQLFCQSCKKQRLDEITGDDLREFVTRSEDAHHECHRSRQPARLPKSSRTSGTIVTVTTTSGAWSSGSSESTRKCRAKAVRCLPLTFRRVTWRSMPANYQAIHPLRSTAIVRGQIHPSPNKQTAEHREPREQL